MMNTRKMTHHRPIETVAVAEVEAWEEEVIKMEMDLDMSIIQMGGTVGVVEDVVEAVAFLLVVQVTMVEEINRPTTMILDPMAQILHHEVEVEEGEDHTSIPSMIMGISTITCVAWIMGNKVEVVVVEVVTMMLAIILTMVILVGMEAAEVEVVAGEGLVPVHRMLAMATTMETCLHEVEDAAEAEGEQGELGPKSNM